MVVMIDSGASKHMTGFKETFVRLLEHESPHKVKLGDDHQYPIKGSGESSYKLDFGKSLTMKEVLFAPGLKKEYTHETNKDKYSIVISLFCYAFVYIQLLYYAW